jgi:putative RecB family exonuclease
MEVYSHSRLKAYKDCPRKYKLKYLVKTDPGTEGIEAFVGNVVHGTLEKCYKDAKLTKVNTMEELLSYYDVLWEKSWHSAVVIRKKGFTESHYRQSGNKMIGDYYKRYVPFDSDTTIGTEMNVNFPLDDSDRYKLRGKIDRLSRTADDIYEIHDYKTSASLPTQEHADKDHQLALYQIGVRKEWPHIKDFRLIWHYLAFDTELVSCRSKEDLSQVAAQTISAIDEIEAAKDFPPKESGLCAYCEYPDLCPKRKHFVIVEALPVNEYLKEPGVVLVNKCAELRQKIAVAKEEFKQGTSGIEGELAKVEEAIIDYAKREQVEIIKGSTHKARAKIEEKLKFPGKNDVDRQPLDNAIQEAEKWMEVSQLDTAALVRVIQEGRWTKQLIQQVMDYGRIEEASSVHLSKLKDEED